jgi:cysteine-rich repeat protein
MSSGEVGTLAGSVVGGIHDGRGTGARFNYPMSVAFDSTGTELFIADTNSNLIRRLQLPLADVTTIAGSVVGYTYVGAVGRYTGGFLDGPALTARLDAPQGLALSPDGATLYFADAGNHAVRALRRAAVSTLAGSPTAGSADGPATAARFSRPAGLALRPDGAALLIADAGNGRVRTLDLATRAVATFAGAGTPSAGGPAAGLGFRAGIAPLAALGEPAAVAWPGPDLVLVADRAGRALCRIAPAGCDPALAGPSSFPPRCPAGGGAGGGPECRAGCLYQAGFYCADACGIACPLLWPAACAPVCGDGVASGAEECDDGNAAEGDGCSASCRVEAGWACARGAAAGPWAWGCATMCGDGVVAGPEECDDGNALDGDGCGPACRVETGWACARSGGACRVGTTAASGTAPAAPHATGTPPPGPGPDLVAVFVLSDAAFPVTPALLAAAAPAWEDVSPAAPAAVAAAAAVGAAVAGGVGGVLGRGAAQVRVAVAPVAAHGGRRAQAESVDGAWGGDGAAVRCAVRASGAVSDATAEAEAGRLRGWVQGPGPENLAGALQTGLAGGPGVAAAWPAGAGPAPTAWRVVVAAGPGPAGGVAAVRGNGSLASLAAWLLPAPGSAAPSLSPTAAVVMATAGLAAAALVAAAWWRRRGALRVADGDVAARGALRGAPAAEAAQVEVEAAGLLQRGFRCHAARVAWRARRDALGPSPSRHVGWRWRMRHA